MFKNGSFPLEERGEIRAGFFLKRALKPDLTLNESRCLFLGVLGTCGDQQPFRGSVSLVITYRLTDKRPLQRAHMTLGVPLVKS